MTRPPAVPALLVLAAATACGGVVIEAPTAPSAAPGEAPARPPRPTRADELRSAQVYDAAGNASACAPPLPSCPQAEVDRAFLDRCRAGGFQVRQCGCEQRCGGDVRNLGRRYDANGNAKECPTDSVMCVPPQASAAFQDACTEKGYRMEVCGCEWLCTGNPKR